MTATIERTAPVQAPVCGDCAARRTSLCGVLDDEMLRGFHKIGARRKVARGETIVWAGQRSANCFNILSGLFKLTAATSDGREQVVGLLYPGDLIGRPFADQAHHTVTALGNAEVCAFPREGFEQLLVGHRQVEHELLCRMFDTLDSARGQMLMLARQSAGERVADFLLRMADRIGGVCALAGGPVTFDLPLSRATIADVLSLTIETVSRQMTKLKVANIIRLPGGRAVTILRRDQLQALAGRS